jgi:hypothetical protein
MLPTVPVDPDLFLGGSAPRLQTLFLERISFPGLPKLLLSATHLVQIYLGILHSGYIPPEAMVTGLSVLTRLECLKIEFESPRSRPDRRSPRPPLQTRTLLPALTELWFRGVGEYLEDLVARIDAPLLDDLRITLLHQLIFDTPQLTQFISRTPKIKALAKASVVFNDRNVYVALPRISGGTLRLTIPCTYTDQQLPSLAQVCGSSFPQTLLAAVECLHVLEGSLFSQPRWRVDVETRSSQWSELFYPFTAVKELYISRNIAPSIALALQELVGERMTEVLPTVQTLFLETPSSGPVQEVIGQFVAARQLAGYPIVVSLWKD